jgi:DNA polymerase III epsilon subunit-like protein
MFEDSNMLENNDVAKKELETILQRYIDKCDTYISGRTSNVAEAANSAIASSAPKNKDFRSSYPMRADIGLLNKEMGFEWIEQVMNLAGFTLFKFSKTELSKMQTRKRRWAEIKNSIAYKQRRLELRGVGMARNTATINEANQGWVYGKDPIPESQLEQIKKAGADKQKPQSCGCSKVKGVFCSRESCTCNKLGQQCSIYCLCQGDCGSKQGTPKPVEKKNPNKSAKSKAGCKCDKDCKRCNCKKKKQRACTIFCNCKCPKSVPQDWSPTSDIFLLDTETTGFGKKSRMLEIALIHVDSGGKFHSLLKIPFVPSGLVNGITASTVKDAPEFSAVANELISWVSTTAKAKVLIAAHHGHFDKEVFERECKSAQIPVPDWEWRNTIPIFGRAFINDDLKSKSLDYLCQKYLKKSSTAHRAQEDLENLKSLMDIVTKRCDLTKPTSYVWGYFFSIS